MIVCLSTGRQFSSLPSCWRLPFAVAYLVNPLDFDFIPIFGRIDDLVVGAFVILVPGAWLFIRMCPDEVVQDHVDRISRGE